LGVGIEKGNICNRSGSFGAAEGEETDG